MNSQRLCVLLKNPATGLYLKNGVAWTDDMNIALSFDCVARARRFCAAHRLPIWQTVAFFREDTMGANSMAA